MKGRNEYVGITPYVLQGILLLNRRFGEQRHEDWKLLVEMNGEQIHFQSIPYFEDPFKYYKVKRTIFPCYLTLVPETRGHGAPSDRKELANQYLDLLCQQTNGQRHHTLQHIDVANQT